MKDRVDLDELLSRLKEVEELLECAGVEGHAKRTEKLLISIARNAPSVAAADAAMSALSLILEKAPRVSARTPENIDGLLSRIRLALGDPKQDAGNRSTRG